MRNVREILKFHFEERRTKNPRFSLRAYAKLLDTTPSYISEVLSGKKKLAPTRALQFAKKLRFNPLDAEYLSIHAELESSTGPDAMTFWSDKLDIWNRKSKATDLGLDRFEAMANWYHIPILELTEHRDGISGPAPIVKKLGLSQIEAEQALERLLRIGVLSRDARGKYIKTASIGIFESPERHDGLRQFHRQMIHKSLEAVESQAPGRFVGSETFLFDPKYSDEANRIVENFLSQMASLSKRSANEGEVFHLAVQFFPVTKTRARKKLSPP